MTVKPSKMRPVRLELKILFAGEIGVQISDVWVWVEPVTGAPGEEFGQGEVLHLSSALFDDQVVDRNQVSGGKTELREEQVDAVETKGILASQLAQIGLAQAGTVADDKATLIGMRIFQLFQLADALSPA